MSSETEEDVRLAAALRGLGDGLEPPPGWQAGVRARLDAPAPRRFAWLLGTGAALALAAAVLIVWRVRTPAPVRPVAVASTPAPAPLSIDTEVIAQGAPVRGRGAHPGDVWHIRAHAPVAPYLVVLVYHDADVVLSRRCPEDAAPRCTSGAADTEVTLGAPGSYRAATIVSETVLPTGSPAEILDAALRSGARVQWSATLEVR